MPASSVVVDRGTVGVGQRNPEVVLRLAGGESARGGHCCQPSSRSRVGDGERVGVALVGRDVVERVEAASAMAALNVAACHRRVTTGGPIRMAKARCSLR